LAATWYEINPEDAKARGFESGNMDKVSSADVVKKGGDVGFEEGDLSFTKLLNDGHMKNTGEEVEGVAIVPQMVPNGLMFSNFIAEGSPANSLVHVVLGPITKRYRFKLGGSVKILSLLPLARKILRL
jgi:arsenite oxidase large subunit